MLRDKTTKTIALPSGGTMRIRAMSVRDYLEMGDDLPNVLAPEAPTGAAGPMTTAQQKLAARRTEQIVLRCCGRIEEAGQSLRIVEKRFDECADGEISLDEFLATPDCAAAVTAVLELSGSTQAAREAARTFPSQETATGPDPARVG